MTPLKSRSYSLRQMEGVLKKLSAAFKFMLFERDGNGNLASLLLTNNEETMEMMELATEGRAESFTQKPRSILKLNPNSMRYLEKPSFFKVAFNKKEEVKGQPDKLIKSNVLVEAKDVQEALAAVSDLEAKGDIGKGLEIEAVLRVGFEGAVAVRD